ncbi:unnamed protein product [Laminaria digitata]
MAQARTGRWVALIVAVSAVIAGLFVSSPQAFFKSGNSSDSSSSGCGCCSSSSTSSGSGTSSSSSSSTSSSGSSSKNSILSIFAREAFDWSTSTTPAPLSATAVLVKAILADKGTLPAGLGAAVLSAAAISGDDGTAAAEQVVLDVRVGPVRDFISSQVLESVRQLCASSSTSGGDGCDPNEVDPDFGTTPLHLAELWGSRVLSEYLLSIGADPEMFDTVGRQPRNMTFKAFSANSKKAAGARLPSGADPEDRCEIPEVTIPLFPGVATTANGGGKALSASEEIAAANEWRDSAAAALSEVRRLVSEGEPVMVRNVIPWLLADPPLENPEDNENSITSTLQYQNAAQFVEAWGQRPVDVGSVPYAKNFNLTNERTTLKDYVTRAAATAEGGGAPLGADKARAPTPTYVFQVDIEACAEGRELLGRVVEAALPSSGENPIVCPPASGQRGLESVHYYLGARWTGAPFHIHSDALNVAVSGKKKWWVVTPRSAVWSRRHIQEYAEEGKGGPGGGEEAKEEERPMECVQRGGDMVYVPGDWGHAAMNVEDDTFG